LGGGGSKVKLGRKGEEGEGTNRNPEKGANLIGDAKRAAHVNHSGNRASVLTYS